MLKANLESKLYPLQLPHDRADVFNSPMGISYDGVRIPRGKAYFKHWTFSV